MRKLVIQENVVCGTCKGFFFPGMMTITTAESLRSMNPRPNITRYPVCIGHGGGNGGNRDLVRGSPNITISGSLETVGTGVLI